MTKKLMTSAAILAMASILAGCGTVTGRADSSPNSSPAVSAAQNGGQAQQDTAQLSDPYLGTYYADRAVMTISSGGNNTYSIHIDWSSSAVESSAWDMNDVFDANGYMNYSNCVETHIFFDENQTENRETVFTNGTGSVQVSGSTASWTDNGSGNSLTFTKD